VGGVLRCDTLQVGGVLRCDTLQVGGALRCDTLQVGGVLGCDTLQVGSVLRCDTLHVEDGENFILNGATHIPNYTASRVKSISLIPTRQPKILRNILYSLFMYGFLVGEN
jgi:hypothetical protein